MADNSTEYVIRLGGDDAPLRAIVNSFKSSFRSAAADIEATANKIQLFTGVEKNVKDASAAFFKATEAAAAFRAQIAKIEGAGGTVGKELTDALKSTERQVAATSKEFNKQSAQLDKLRASLTTAGVDTKNLAAEQAKLTTQLKAQQKIDADRNAAAVLGIKLTKDQTAAIQQQFAALNTLRANGLASSKDIAAAQAALNANVKSITEGVKQGAVAANNFGASLKTGLIGAVGPFIAVTTVLATVTAGFKAAIDAAKEYRQGIAEIGAVTNLSKEQLAELGKGVRQVATDLGVDLNQALKATQDLLASGVSPDNVLEVLRVSAEAAKAAVTDVGVGAKAATVLLDSFNLTVDQLAPAFDAIINSAHNGGPSLKAFADNAAQLGNAAQATGQDFNTVIGLLQVMTDKSNDAAGSAALLAKVLINVAKPETITKLRVLGIETTNVAEILQQVGERSGTSVNEFLDLGVASGKAGAGLAALTNNLKEVPGAIQGAAEAIGAVAAARDKLFDSPKERADRFNSQLHETSLRLGETIGAASKLATAGTFVLKFFNDVGDAADGTIRKGSLLDNTFSRWTASLFVVQAPLAEAKKSLGALNEEQQKAAQLAKLTESAITSQKNAIQAFSAQLVTDVKAIQDAQTRDIADIQTRADAQIAALDRSRVAEAATVAATLTIQLQAGKDKLAIIQANEKAITDATNAAATARLKAAKSAGESDKQAEAASNAIRLQGIGQTLAAYQQLYGQLIALAQNAAARVQGFEQARVDIVQRVEDEIRGIRFGALSGLDQYVARMAEIDRLVSEGRKAAAVGDTKEATKFFDNAIEASKGLTEVVKADGTVLITATQAQTDKVRKLRETQDAANQSFGDQAAAAKKGGDEAQKQADALLPKIKGLQTTYDTLKNTIAEGLKIKVEHDQTSFNAALSALNELTKDRTVTITTVFKGGGAPDPNFVGPPSPGFRRGGFVPGLRTTAAALNRGGEVVRQYARGGPVFRKPSWMKVPGTGSGDTVPARLQPGSFVVRKSAAGYYGDGLMSRLARGYGVGGAVLKADVQRYAQTIFGFDPFSGNKPLVLNPRGGSAPVSDKKFRSGDSFQSDPSKEPPISFDTRPVPAELITAMNVIEYAKEMLNAVGQTNPMLGVLLPTILDGIRQVESNPADTEALKKLLQAAETIGSNPYVFDMWGLTSSHPSARKPEWFVDWLTLRGLIGGDGKPTGGEGGLPINASPFMQRLLGGTPKIASQFFNVPDFASRFFGQAIKQVGQPAGSPVNRPPEFFVPFAGGGSTDTVPAMLTPGEFVVKKRAASRYGSDFLHAINTMAIPRNLLANMMQPPMPVRRFADGGSVGSASGSASGGQQSSGGPRSTSAGAFAPTINMNVSAADIFSRDNLNRHILPWLSDLDKRTR